MKEQIKNWLKTNWFKAGLLIILIICIGGAFYWYGLRSSNIKKSCAIWALDRAINLYGNYGDSKNYQPDLYDHYFKRCLREKGL
jgi:predicted negative regulator of RcsB-dependent stress response